MKNYIIKNYKGNLVESLKNFSKKYKGMRVTEAKAEGNTLKILAENAEVKAEYKINTFTQGFGKDVIEDFNMFSKNLTPYEIVYDICEGYAKEGTKVLEFFMFKLDGKDETNQANDIMSRVMNDIVVQDDDDEY